MKPPLWSVVICLAIVLVQSRDEDTRPVTSLCRIPHLPHVKFSEDGEEVPEPGTVAGDLVVTDISSPLFYKCRAEEEWAFAVCDSGKWNIPESCIISSCHLEQGRAAITGNTTTIRCRWDAHNSMTETVNMTCMPGGYWSPYGCGQALNCPKKTKYTVDRQPLQTVRLNGDGKARRIVLCPKGKTMCRRSNCTAGQWYQVDGSLSSGLEVVCGNLINELKRFKCNDVDECKLMKTQARNLQRQEECENAPQSGGGSTADGAQGDDESDDNSQCQAPNLRLAERGITACHSSARCKNTDPGYKCVCLSYLTKQDDGSCLLAACPDVSGLENGRIRNIQNRTLDFSCNDVYHLQPGTHKTFYCKHGKWHSSRSAWDNVFPTCNRTKRCRPPTSPAHGYVSGVNFRENDIVTYRCDHGYLLQGLHNLQGRYERTCTDGRYWSGYQPFCKPNLKVLTYADELRTDNVDKHSDKTSADFTNQTSAERTNVAGFGLDVYFLIDTSSSMRGQETLNKILCLVKAIVGELLSAPDIPTNLTRVDIMTVGSQIVEYLKFDDHRQGNLIAIKEVIRSIKFTGGGTYLLNATNSLRMKLNVNNRVESKKVLVLITDGHFNIDQNPDINFRAMGRQSRINILIAICVGSNSNVQKLKDVARDFYSSSVYKMDDWDEMTELADRLFNTKKKSALCGFAGRTTKTEQEKDDGKYRLIEGSRNIVIEGSYPWLILVSVNISNVHVGAGNLICSQWVLTSTSTITNRAAGTQYDKDTISLSAGLHYLRQETGSDNNIQNARVAEIIVHPSRDIALLRLTSPLRISDNVRPVCLLSREGKIFDKSVDSNIVSAYFVGWGAKSLEPVRDKTGKELNVITCPEGTPPPGDEEDNVLEDREIIGGATVAMVPPTEAAMEENAPEFCSSGDIRDVFERDRGGALMFKLQDVNRNLDDTLNYRHVAVGLAKPQEDSDGVEDRFESLLGAEEWIHSNTDNCNVATVQDEDIDSNTC